MKWIQTGIQIGQAVKNVQRLRQILAVFAKYGFADILVRMNLRNFLSARLTQFAASQAELTTQERLRLAFEELGPTFVKLGQLLSSRSDLLPESYVDEFRKLQDNVQPLTFEVVKEVVEKQLGKSLSEAYASFSPIPLAAASIGQVHEATLHTGEKVVVKIQRPEIEKIIETDISLLAFLAGLLEKYVPETKVIGPKTIVDEFFRTLYYELDFIVEANNVTKMKANLSSIPEIVIPLVYKQLSTNKILTMEKIEGLRVNDLKGLDAAGIDRKAIVAIGTRAFFKSVMIDGLFHGDLHGGNLFVLPGNKLGIVDFGIVGRLSEKSRDQLASMVMALLSEDYENLCYTYADLGNAGPSVDFDGFQREVRNTLSPYVGLSLDELNSGRILIEATKIAAKYDIKIPGDWMLVFKAIFTIEGMGRSLDPTFDLLAAGQDLVKDLVKEQYSFQRISRDFAWIAKDVASLAQTLPRQIRWMFKKFNSNDFAFEFKSPDIQNLKYEVEQTGRRVSLGIIGAGLFIASSIAMNSTAGHQLWHYPVISVIYFAAGCFVLLRMVIRSFK